MSDLVGCRGWGGWLRDVEKPRSGSLEAAKWNCDSWGSVETLRVAVASPESSMFAILSPPKAWERLRSPFMANSGVLECRGGRYEQWATKEGTVCAGPRMMTCAL